MSGEDHIPVLSPEQVARIAGCSRSTVINYSNGGMLVVYYDSNGYRRYPMSEAKKLGELLAHSRKRRNEAGRFSKKSKPSMVEDDV